MAAESRKSLAPSPPDQVPEEDLVIVKVEEDHGWDQESSLHENNPPGQELFRLRFRKLCYQETLGPREALIQLRALCLLSLLFTSKMVGNLNHPFHAQDINITEELWLSTLSCLQGKTVNYISPNHSNFW